MLVYLTLVAAFQSVLTGKLSPSLAIAFTSHYLHQPSPPPTIAFTGRRLHITFILPSRQYTFTANQFLRKSHINYAF